jgi:hypothetical protein
LVQRNGESMRFIVTVKFGFNIKHDPKNKVVGSCSWSETCTDSTGSHHSVLVDAPNIDAVKLMFQSYHVTRIEGVDK